jgi:hypothetical protein
MCLVPTAVGAVKEEKLYITLWGACLCLEPELDCSSQTIASRKTSCLPNIVDVHLPKYGFSYTDTNTSG